MKIDNAISSDSAPSTPMLNGSFSDQEAKELDDENEWHDIFTQKRKVSEEEEDEDEDEEKQEECKGTKKRKIVSQSGSEHEEEEEEKKEQEEQQDVPGPDPEERSAPLTPPGQPLHKPFPASDRTKALYCAGTYWDVFHLI